ETGDDAATEEAQDPGNDRDDPFHLLADHEVAEAAGHHETPYTPPPPPPPPPGGSYTPPPPPPPGAPAPNSDRTIMLVLSYLGILCLIPLLMKKDDPEVQWHAKNGTVLFGAEVVVFIVRIMLIFIRIPFLTCGLTLVFCFVW